MVRTHGILFFVLAILASLVMVLTSILPWFVFDLPFQRMWDIEDMVIHDIETRQVCIQPFILLVPRTIINEEQCYIVIILFPNHA